MTCSNSINFKVCTQCGIAKNKFEFNAHKGRKSGLDDQCRTCVKLYKESYYRSHVGHIAKIYSSQKSSSRRRGNQPPEYTLKELRVWLLSMPEFYDMFDRWVESEYSRWLSPSVDRINDYIGYTMDNIQLMVWQDNYDKGMCDRKRGINNKLNKSVDKCTKNGEYLSTYYSIHQACRENGVKSASNITKCCIGERDSAGGYAWRFA